MQTAVRLAAAFALGLANLGAQEPEGQAPPPHFDKEPLQWTDDEDAERLAAALWMCTRGDYERAHAALQPAASKSAAPAGTDPLDLTRRRVLEVLELRRTLITTAITNGLRISPRIDGKFVGGKLIGATERELTLEAERGRIVLPMQALTPWNLLVELRKQKLVAESSWQRAWLEWLHGETPAKAMQKLDDASPLGASLRRELTAPFDAKAAAPAAALATILSLEPASSPAAAFEQLETFCTAVKEHRRHPLFDRRTNGLRFGVRTLAHRAFSVRDPRCLGLACEKVVWTKSAAGSDRIALDYSGSGKELAADFQFDAAAHDRFRQQWDEAEWIPPSFAQKGKVYELAGTALYVLPLRLKGRMSIEMRHRIPGGGIWGVVMALREDNAALGIGAGGHMYVYDPVAKLSAQVGESAEVPSGTDSVLAAELDGTGKATASVFGTTISRTSKLGTLGAGRIGLYSHDASPIRIVSLHVEGELDPAGEPELRDAFVERMAARIE